MNKVFILIWLTQSCSWIASASVGFALRVLVFEQNKSVSEFALLTLCSSVPALLCSTVAGSTVDRRNRRHVMIASDVLVALITLSFLFDNDNNVSLAWIYVCSALISALNEFQSAAFDASVAQLVSERNYERALGMVEVSGGVAQLVSPFIGGSVLSIGSRGLATLIGADVALCLVAVGVLCACSFPPVKQSEAGRELRGTSLLDDCRFAARFVWRRAELLTLLVVFSLSNFCSAFIFELLPPLVLIVLGDAQLLGAISSAAGCGALLASLGVAVCGGAPARHRWPLIVALLGLQGALMSCAVMEASAVLIGSLGFVYCACDVLIGTASSAIWNEATPDDVKGRVYAMRRIAASSAAPVAVALAGPLAEQLFEPIFSVDSSSWPLAEWLPNESLVGVGPGKGIAALLSLVGIAHVFLALCAALFAKRSIAMKLKGD
jgi:Major Facilitator Superfamily